MDLKVDLLVGKRRERIDGISRYYGEVMRRIREEVDLKVIGYGGQYDSTLDKMLGLTRYPLLTRREIREGSIKHLVSMVEAHLLNYTRLQPSIVTCYDIFPLMPASYPLLKRGFLKYAARGMLKADRIITISEFSKREIADKLGYPREKIDVIYPGVDLDRYKPMPGGEDLVRKLGLDPDQKIILYVGMEQPRKNIPALLGAFARLRQSGIGVTLLKVGRPHRAEDRKNLLESIEEQGLSKDVVILDYIDEEELPGVYNIAELFVFPSLYEGFGLPPLEAMACGCPVITSNAASLPEVVGDAAVTLDPLDVEGLAEMMNRVLTEDSLRRELIGKGLEQAGRFSWEKTAQNTLEVYRAVAETG